MNATLVEKPQQSSRCHIKSWGTRTMVSSIGPNLSQVKLPDKAEIHTTVHHIPVSDPLAQVTSRIGPAVDASDMLTLQKHEIAPLIGVIVLALLWYGVLWLG